MMSDTEPGRLDALVLKLRHPLPKIRYRALHTLQFKLRERLVRWQELEPLHKTLIPALLAGLEPPLGIETLHVLQVLIQTHSKVFLTSLQHYGAAQKLQRAAIVNPELQPSFEKLLSQLYTTKHVGLKSNYQEPRIKLEEHHEPKMEPSKVHSVQSNRHIAPKLERLESCGWTFAQVALVAVDDQYLFEFEVKLQLRTETLDIVAACATFRNELLRNFPAEIFLQRPTILQYLLHLIQQPILPTSGETSTDQKTDVWMEKAMKVSMGVNYFDAMGSKTYATKRGNVTGAVVMASLQAIESFLFALRVSQNTCLDPSYVVHKPFVPVEGFDSYDTRRVFYPRARVEGGHDVRSGSERRSDCQMTQYSFSGAIYKLFVSLLPLLRSARHPRLHLLNLLSSALLDLPEKSRGKLVESSVHELDKERLERIFDILNGICRPVRVHDADFGVIDSELELTHSMTWKLVELVLRLLRLYSARHYVVADSTTEVEHGEMCAKSSERSRILIPRQLWEAVKLWVATPEFPIIAIKEWNDESIIQDLSAIDATLPAFIQIKQSSQQDANLILEFVKFANNHREALTDFKSWTNPVGLSLETARKAMQTREAFSETNAKVIADATLLTIWSVLTTQPETDDKRLTQEKDEIIRFILCDLLSGLGQKEASMAHDPMVLSFFSGFLTLIDSFLNESLQASSDCRRQRFVEVVCESKFLSLLLLVLARQHDADDQLENAPLWAILRVALHQLADVWNDKLGLLEPVIPLMQHFAYIKSSEKFSQEQRSTQPKLADILLRVDSIVSDRTRYITICRCLLHESTYIRIAAASGILCILSQNSPSCNDWISKHEEILHDPFGGPYSLDGDNVNLEATLMATPLPVYNAVAYTPSDNELSSQLSKLSHLSKVISGTSSTLKGLKETALKELVMAIENASVEIFSLFEELGKLSDLLEVICTIIQLEGDQIESSLVYQSLLLFRIIIFRSSLLRSATQCTCVTIQLLIPYIFHPSTSIRAQMYYILLILTCSAENFIPTGVSVESLNNEKDAVYKEAKIPAMLMSTFGLYAHRWTRCFIRTCSINQQLQASAVSVAKSMDPFWLDEVTSIISHRICCRDAVQLDETKTSDLARVLSAEYALVVQKLREAPSHDKCLNALYHAMMMCKAWRIGREQFATEWETACERYFATPPKSARDEVILASLVSTLSVLLGAMTRAEQLRVLIVVKRTFLPLLQRAKTSIFSLQMARLLLNMSDSKVRDLFLSLAADTDIVSIICTRYSTVYANEPVLHALMLEVLLRFARGMDEKAALCLSKPLRDKICKRLHEMLAPLLTIVCRHRVPGSFMDRDVFVAGSQCMIAILHTLPRASLAASDSPLQHTDSSILLDGSWASRLLFDHVSPIRELGFCVIEQAAALDPLSLRLLEMAVETSTDESESDAVRAAACFVTIQEILQYSERTLDRQTALRTMVHGRAFAKKVVRTLSGILNSNKLLIRAACTFARQVRVLLIQRKSLASQFGDMQQELETAQEEEEIYSLFIQALSIREWKSKCNRYCSSCMLLPECNEHAWRRSLLPAILDLLIEVLNLLQALCCENGFGQVSFFLLHTTLLYQLMATVEEVYDSSNDIHSVAERSKHYEVLDLSATTLSSLLVQAFDEHNELDIKQFDTPVASRSGGKFIATVAKMLEPQHPTAFRISFSRVVAAVSRLIPGALKAAEPMVMTSLCSTIFDLYQETAEFKPHDATLVPGAHNQAFSSTCIRRVACGLQVLLEASPTLRPLIHMKRGVPFAMTCMKESFTAIRIAGGFGGKRGRNANSSASPQDAYVLDLCSRIQTHMEVVTSIIGDDKDSQQLAKDEGILSVILSNWNMMKTAHVRGSHLMIRALYLVANYIYGNDSAKKSMLTSLSHGSERAVKGDNTPSLIALLFDLVNTRGEVTALTSRIQRNGNVTSEADMTLSNAACQVLQAALLNVECVLHSVKMGTITKLVDLVQHRLQQVRQGGIRDHREYQNLAHMLSVLSSIASSHEGARFLYTNVGTVLSVVFDDVIHISNENIRQRGCFFMRNLSLSQTTNNHFAFWEELLDAMVGLCVRVSDARQSDAMCLEYVSVALWSLVYDNQKARALLRSKPATIQSLKQALSSQTSASSPDIAENLRRVLMLIHA